MDNVRSLNFWDFTKTDYCKFNPRMNEIECTIAFDTLRVFWIQICRQDFDLVITRTDEVIPLT